MYILYKVGHQYHTIKIAKLTLLYIYLSVYTYMSFPVGSDGKESTCNAGDTGDVGSIPGLGRSSGGGHGNSL